MASKGDPRKRRLRKRALDYKHRMQAAQTVREKRTVLQQDSPSADLSFKWNEQPIPHWDRTRRWILRRDKFQCRGCGMSARTWDAQRGGYVYDWEILQVHHVTPRRFGGDELQDNLISLCAGCHLQIELGLQRSGVLTDWQQQPFPQLKRACQQWTNTRIGMPIPLVEAPT